MNTFNVERISLTIQMPAGGELLYKPNVTAADPKGVNPFVLVFLFLIIIGSGAILLRK
jgi:hypothetical protein